MTPAALRRLQALAEARRLAALSRLDRLQAEDRRLAGAIVELSAMPAREIAENPDGLPHYARRLAWVGHRIAALERRRRELISEIAAARSEAGVSVGKHEALGVLVRQADRAAVDHRATRAEREAPPAAPDSGRGR